MEASPPSGGGKRAVVIALGIAALGIIVIGLWFGLRPGKRTPFGVTAAKQPATQSANKAQLSGASFTESVNGAQIEMIAVPGGTFLMGSPAAEAGRDMDEGPQSEVTVAKLYMSRYEVTQAQYQAAMNTNPSSFKGDNLPVDSVTWENAEEFCRKLSQITKRDYRLPTEAEWEYASRAGTNGAFAGDVDAMTWYSANSGNRTHAVGQKHPNAFGLYDMNGNVWEWCQSKYKPYPYKADDGRENVQDTDVRVMRGGSWENGSVSCRSAYRRRVIPSVRATIGFRIVLAGN
jgi:formylglycine-generating enzyme required for sulfatase activity